MNTLTAFERAHRNDHEQEHAALWDNDGDLLVIRIGGKDSVDFTANELEAACMGTVTHTHPHGKPPSGEDLATAARYGLTLRAVGSTPDGESYDYTVIMPGPSEQMAERLLADFDTQVEQTEYQFADMNEWKREREARNLVITRLARQYGFFYQRVQHQAISEMARRERDRLDTFSLGDKAIQQNVLMPLHAQLVRSLTRHVAGNGIVPLDHLESVKADSARLVQLVMLGKARPDGTLVPYSVQRGQVVPNSPYFGALYSAMRATASAAVSYHARMMRKYLPEDLRRAYEFASIDPFTGNVSETDLGDYDPLHLWVGPDGKRLSDRIWQATGDMRVRLDTFLTTAIASGQSVSAIASGLEQFLLEGSGAYEALRLARTEVAAAHAHADSAAAQLNPFVESYTFFTAPEHQCCDECDDVEAGSPYPKSDTAHLPPRHPSCICGVRWNEVERPATVVDRLRQSVQAALAGATQALTDIIGPLSHKFVDLLFRTRSE